MLQELKMNNAIFVTKRDNTKEEVSFDKVLKRMKILSNELNVNPHLIAQKLCNRIYDGVKTSELDILGAEICANMITIHPDYGILAARISMSNLEKNTSPSFSETIQILYDNVDIRGNKCPLISQELYDIVKKHKTKLNSVIKPKRDSNINYFGLKTLERSYLLKVKGQIVEKPQYLFMRVALGIHGENIKEAVKTYDGLSEQYFIHATPTLFNAGTKRPQLSSCFLLAMNEDSIGGIYDTQKNCALISKWAGGIGLHIHNIRAKGSMIRGTNGISNGIVPMLRVFNNTARYVDQCVLPETIIYSTKGPIKMEDVVVGETEIYNLNGEIEVVENVLEHSYDGKMFSINTTHSLDNLNITPEHPVYCLQGQTKGTNYSVIKNRLNNNLIRPEWIEAGKLTDEDMLIYPIPTFEKDIENITKEDCYVYGAILGDGSLPNDKSYGYISLHSKNKSHVLEKVENYFNSKFIRNRTEVNDNTTRIYWNKDVSLPFKYSDIYQNKKKFCHTRWLNLPLDKSKYILKGLIDTDGSIGNEIVFDNTSYNLIESVRFICLRMGILTSGYKRDRVGETHITSSGRSITNKKISYTLRIPKTSEICELLEVKSGNFTKFLRHENLLFSRIKDIQESEYKGTLYDLQMTKEHNYLLHQGLVHNGGGKRNGSIAIYLEPWHADIEDFLLLRKNHGNEEERARDLFYALWTPDLFMERVKNKGKWTLMCPDECPGLSDCYGEGFKLLYEQYEAEGRGKKTVDAQTLWAQILESQIETGTPYLLFKDACNEKSNQKNLGTIKSSNLCCEIVEYSSKDEAAVCNLASIGLPRYIAVNPETNENYFDYDKLTEMTKMVTRNLNKVIDVNYYPIPETRNSNLKHRPIGIGVQGLADVFAKLKVGFDSLEAVEINKKIFETIYFASLESSMEISKKREKSMKKYKDLCQKIDNTENEEEKDLFLKEKVSLEEELKPIREELNRDKYLGTYSTYEGSPISQGILQFDMWNVEPSEEMKPKWDKLRKDIKRYGVRNSLLVAPMPTASTSQIMGNNECFEPYTSNIYIRRTLAGEFIVINDHLVRDLIKLGIWNEDIKNEIIKNEGSIQSIENIPDNIKNVYKTVWEMSQKNLINMAADRGAFICQSQSLNLFIAQPDFSKLTSMHFYSWKKGLKTGIYYLRTKPVAKAQQFTIEPEKKKKEVKNEDNSERTQEEKNVIMACRRDNPDCLTCGS
jgi:ribonucleotide reductase alpha subunit